MLGPGDQLDEQPMRPSLRTWWLSLPLDARAVLRAAFEYAMTHPYKARFGAFDAKIIDEKYVEFQEIKVGYATFVVALVRGSKSIVWDMELKDEDPRSSRGFYLSSRASSDRAQRAGRAFLP